MQPLIPQIRPVRFQIIVIVIAVGVAAYFGFSQKCDGPIQIKPWKSGETTLNSHIKNINGQSYYCENYFEKLANKLRSLSYSSSTQSTNQLVGVEYKNNTYGFSFSLPDSWHDYSIVTGLWIGNEGLPDAVTGPQISIRNPKWTAQNPYQDIPIMIFTLSQWQDLQQDKFHVGAAPINPSELGRNSRYVFALPARYNYAFPMGYEEVEQILANNPLHAF